jgi:hypothetical protein
MTQRRPKEQIPPASTGVASTDDAINTEIAFYNLTGNMLALWAVLAICVREGGINLPPGVDFRFARVAEQLLQYSEEETLGARELVADLVLGTKNESGGSSVFKEYALHKRASAIIARTRELLMQDVESLQNHTMTRSEKKSQSRIYEQVADEYSLEPETVKRLFEEDDRNAGSFGYRVLRQKPKPDGIVDV